MAARQLTDPEILKFVNGVVLDRPIEFIAEYSRMAAAVLLLRMFAAWSAPSSVKAIGSY